MAALKAAKTVNTTVRSKAPLVALFESMDSINQREFAGLSKQGDLATVQLGQCFGVWFGLPPTHCSLVFA